MSDTYTGWDGKSYPWPPPDGWYLASDGRWWAPGTGPNAPAAQVAAPVPPVGTSPPPVADGYGPSAAETTQLPTLGGSPTGQPRSLLDGDLAGPGPAPGVGGPPATLSDPYAQQSLSYQDGLSWGTPERQRQSSGGFGRIVVVLLVGIVVLGAVGGAAYYFLGDELSGADGAAQTSATPPADEAATTASSEPPSSTDTSAGTTTPGETTTQSSAPSSSIEQGSTTTVGETSSTTTPVEAATLVGDFRAILMDNDLSSDDLTDDQINNFGTQFCIFAQASSDRDEFGSLRQQAIQQANSRLTPEQLGLVTDAAVVVFCPEEADRLGISV